MLVATPVGNLDDITHRALSILKRADVIACEDTRTTRHLLETYNITNKHLIACHDHNEGSSAVGIVKLIGEGKAVALVCDAGMPSIADPGFRVVQAVLKARHKVSASPGPNAALTALSISGLPTDQFTFLGFPPRKSGKRQSLFTLFRDLPTTLVLYESPLRLQDTVKDAITIFGNRKAALALELTKVYERVYREPLSKLLDRLDTPPLGEAVLMIAGMRKPGKHDNKYACFSKAPHRN